MSKQPRPEVVVVTGSSGGVGRAIAHAFAKRGAHIGLLARGEQGLSEAAAEVEGFGGKAIAVPTDVADHEAVEAGSSGITRVRECRSSRGGRCRAGKGAGLRSQVTGHWSEFTGSRAG